jgi:dTDP-glucose 4,6-dehydratase
MKKKYLITGGAGFIGSALVRNLVSSGHKVLNCDKLTYSGDLTTLREVDKKINYKFLRADIGNRKKINKALKSFKPDIVINLAAETHVDRSIDNPNIFINTNINGTLNLLNESYKYFLRLPKKKKFKFIQVSTDEVYGSLGKKGFFEETSPYRPNSPYSASKASADHLVRAWYKTYNFPAIVTNCSNNYGPFQFPEKLIPLIIQNALLKKKLPIYGSGEQIRDWIYVEDHVRALKTISTRGKIGENYNIGGSSELKNIDVVKKICVYLDKIRPIKSFTYTSLISHVKDRPAHDFRYSINNKKIFKNLKWKPLIKFDDGLENTILWYLKNQNWCKMILNKKYKLQRLGILKDEKK